MNAKAQSKPAPLGRGLSALFGDTDVSYTPRKTAHTSAQGVELAQPANAGAGGVRSMPIIWLQPGVYQPRHHFDDDAIDELAASIRERGVLQPLMVRPLEGEKDAYEIVCGERRWRASQKAGLHEVPVIVKNLTDREAMEVGLIENIQRQDLSPIEEGEGYHRLIDEFNHTHDNLAQIVGKSRSHIGNMMRLLKLPDSVKQMISAGELSMGHARSVITSKDPEKLAREIVKKGLNVRQAESLAKREAEGLRGKATKGKSAMAADPNLLALERDLSRTLGLKIKIHAQGDMGTLTIHYTDLDQLEDVLKRLQG
ncbi:MAG: ParB/RepB/Spo0J family partition protein [Alphaproteobacteria bacterium]|nr:ParB/RepB/Spo0J family partition protein [Alphaproteobacteria bacterium]